MCGFSTQDPDDDFPPPPTDGDYSDDESQGKSNPEDTSDPEKISVSEERNDPNDAHHLNGTGVRKGTRGTNGTNSSEGSEGTEATRSADDSGNHGAVLSDIDSQRQTQLKSRLVDKYFTDKQAEKDALAAALASNSSDTSSGNLHTTSHDGNGSDREGTTATQEIPVGDPEESDVLGRTELAQDEVEREGRLLGSRDDDDGNAPSSGGKKSSGFFGKLLKGLEVLGDLTTLTGIENSVYDFQEAGASTTKKTDEEGNEYTDRGRLEEKHKGARKRNSYFSLAGASIGAVTSIAGIHKNRMLKNSTKNDRVRRAAGYGVAASSFGLAANAGKITSLGMKLWGNSGNKTQKGFANWIGFAATASGAVSSGIKWRADSVDKANRNDIISSADSLNGEVTAANEVDVNTRLAAAKSNKNSADIAAITTERNALKAKKYAMEQASFMNTEKNKQMGKGKAGTVLGILSSANSLIQAIPSFASSTWGRYVRAIGSLLPIASTAAKYVEKASDANTAKRMKTAHATVVRNYVNDKTDKILSDAAKEFPGADLSPGEIQCIAIARLGIDVPIKDDGASPDVMEQAFNKLTRKRAEYIMNADEHTKSRCLTALMLDTDTENIEEVEAALRGD